MADKCSEGVLRGFVYWGLGFALGGCFVLGGTRKGFCLSCVNRRALSQSLRIMSITIFAFFGGGEQTSRKAHEGHQGKQPRMARITRMKKSQEGLTGKRGATPQNESITTAS